MFRFLVYRLPIFGWFAAAFLASYSAEVYSQEKAPPPQWIWVGDGESQPQIMVRREFSIAGEIQKATLMATADNQCDVFLNGTKVTSSDDWSQVATSDVSKQLQQGKNVVAISAKNDGGPAGVIAVLQITMKGGASQKIATNKAWKGSTNAKGAWRNIDFDDQGWTNANEIGKLGDAKPRA